MTVTPRFLVSPREVSEHAVERYRDRFPQRCGKQEDAEIRQRIVSEAAKAEYVVGYSPAVQMILTHRLGRRNKAGEVQIPGKGEDAVRSESVIPEPNGNLERLLADTRLERTAVFVVSSDGCVVTVMDGVMAVRNWSFAKGIEGGIRVEVLLDLFGKEVPWESAVSHCSLYGTTPGDTLREILGSDLYQDLEVVAAGVHPDAQDEKRIGTVVHSMISHWMDQLKDRFPHLWRPTITPEEFLSVIRPRPQE